MTFLLKQIKEQEAEDKSETEDAPVNVALSPRAEHYHSLKSGCPHSRTCLPIGRKHPDVCNGRLKCNYKSCSRYQQKESQRTVN